MKRDRLEILKCLLIVAFVTLGQGMFMSAGIAESNERELRFPDEPPAEPADYKMDGYRSMVPTSLKGGIVVTNEQALHLYKNGGVHFVDVMPHIPKPPNLPEGMIWRDKKRENIEKSIWLANVGYGRLPPEMDVFFRDHLKKLTKGDFTSEDGGGLLFYCQKDCWMSWNAAKRALEYGYKKVYWYPEGTDGWIKAGGKVVLAQPEPLPQMTRALK